jgi:hypothetical protein
MKLTTNTNVSVDGVMQGLREPGEAHGSHGRPPETSSATVQRGPWVALRRSRSQADLRATPRRAADDSSIAAASGGDGRPQPSNQRPRTIRSWSPESSGSGGA